MRGRWRWIVLAVAVCAIGRLPALFYAGSIDDEAIYAVVGNVLVDGGRPYLDAIERKPPLLFAVYACVIALAGKYHWLALHGAAVLWVLATMAGLYVLGRRLVDERAGVWAAFAYAIFQPWGTWKNLAFNGEVLMNLPIVWAYAIALHPRDTRLWRWLVAGAFIAAASLLKQPAAIAIVPLALAIWWSDRAEKPIASARRRWMESVALAAGALAVTTTAVVWLLAIGALDEALLWVVFDHASSHVLWSRALLHTAGFMAATLPLVCAVTHWRLQREIWGRHAGGRAMVSWLVVSAVGTAAGGRFYPHYYIQMLPPLAVLAAAVFASPRASEYRMLRPAVAGASFAVALVVFFALGLGGLPRPRPFVAAGEFVRAHSGPEDTIFVWGQSPQLYLEAHRAPSSRYIATFPLTGYIFGVRAPWSETAAHIRPEAWAQFRADVTARPPRFIIDTETDGDAAFPVQRFPELDALLTQHYRLAATVADARIYERCCGR